jgi:hypothetical protein
MAGKEDVFWEREEREKHVFLRNEPDWSALIFEWKYQGIRLLRRKDEFFQSGSFDTKIALRRLVLRRGF